MNLVSGAAPSHVLFWRLSLCLQVACAGPFFVVLSGLVCWPCVLALCAGLVCWPCVLTLCADLVFFWSVCPAAYPGCQVLNTSCAEDQPRVSGPVGAHLCGQPC
jgi:hypothetical protein